ncbi:ubiquinol-cytochrome-c reductase complex assembly factor 3-like [Dendropsophus ebraccatus]|uniref:ubiquinol-cytochrome-c reductase complex assembly factor 3-like n=1 Tax=Dendropsophus ebraccatus TaxID=150705 RepID=UPI003831547E
MSTLYRVVVGSMAVAGWTGLGCLLWSLMAPSQEQLLEMRRGALPWALRHTLYTEGAHNYKYPLPTRVLHKGHVSSCTGVVMATEEGSIRTPLQTLHQTLSCMAAMKEMKENPARMAELQSQNEMVLKVLKEAAETNVNVASKPKWNAR